MVFEVILNWIKTLIVKGSICTVLLSVISLEAAENLNTLDAIWESVEITGGNVNLSKKPTLKVAQNNVQKEAQKKPQSKAKFTRAQYQARYKKEQALLKQRQQLAGKKATKNAPVNVSSSSLERQRAAWKAKWEAEQKAKRLAQVSTKKTIPVNPKHQVVTTLQDKVITPRVPVQNPPKQLTREQYQWRWKQAQLKKKGRTPTVASPTYAIFNKHKQKASFQRLPGDIVSKLRAAGAREHGVSAYAQDVHSPKPLLAYQETTARVPASVMKIITGYAALGTLGPNYRWPMDVYTKGVVKNGTLQGDLIIKGYGSPEFKQTDLRKVLQGIKQKGIRNISGRVVFDSSYFNIPNQYSFDGKKQSKYNAQPDALLFNERVNTFQVRTVGKRVKVSSTTPTHNLKIVNRMRKSSRSCRPKISVSKRAGNTVVTFSGRFAKRCGKRSYSRVISRPAEMIYGSMQAMWKRDVGGKLNTRFAMGRAPSNAQLLLRTYSRSLAEILPTIIKDSNNVMARQLLLTIGAIKGAQGTERAGANAIGHWLASRGLHFPELRIENGSGLSRTARISAAHVGDLLVDAYRSPYRHVFMKSLAIAGVDGTMKGRLKRTQVKGRGFFKTGTLRDVRSIAGYVKAANGKTYVMAILHNDPRARKRALPAHDKLIEWVYAGGRSNRQLAMR